MSGVTGEDALQTIFAGPGLFRTVALEGKRNTLNKLKKHQREFIIFSYYRLI